MGHNITSFYVIIKQMAIKDRIPTISVDKEEKWTYTFWKYLIAVLWIVGFTLLTTIHVKVFHSYMLFAFYPIAIAMFFLDRYGTLFVSGIAITISLWFLESYYLMPWYFLIYGIASFIAYRYAHPKPLNKPSDFPISHNTRENQERNNIYIMYAMIFIVIGSCLVDLLTVSKAAFIMRFPIHIIETSVSGVAVILTVMLYDNIKKKRSERSPYKPPR